MTIEERDYIEQDMKAMTPEKLRLLSVLTNEEQT